MAMVMVMTRGVPSTSGMRRAIKTEGVEEEGGAWGKGDCGKTALHKQPLTWPRFLSPPPAVTALLAEQLSWVSIISGFVASKTPSGLQVDYQGCIASDTGSGTHTT